MADVWVVMPVGDATLNFNGMLTLNDTGAELWKAVERGESIEAMADALTEGYNVARDQAFADVKEFCDKLLEYGCAEN